MKFGGERGDIVQTQSTNLSYADFWVMRMFPVVGEIPLEKAGCECLDYTNILDGPSRYV